MFDQLLLQLGVGGIFALLIVRAVLEFLSKKRPNGNGLSARDVGVDGLKLIILPILEQQVAILAELKALGGRHLEMTIKAQFTLDELKEGQARLRDGLHDLRDKVNVWMGRSSQG